MPVSLFVHNSLRLLVFHLFGQVTKDDVIAAIREAAASIDRPGTFGSLLVFDVSADLGELSVPALKSLRETMKRVYDRAGIRRRRGAAVVDGSKDARFIMPLWDALCLADPDLELRYEIFTDLAPAFDYLKVPEASRRGLIPPLVPRPTRIPRRN